MARNMRCSDTGKDVHFIPDAADRAARHSGEKAGLRLEKYKCQFCGHWHLTKSFGHGRKRETA